MFARVFLNLPDTFRSSVLGSVRHHPAHQMSAVLLPTVWSTAHDVAQSECVQWLRSHRRVVPRCGCGLPDCLHTVPTARPAAR